MTVQNITDNRIINVAGRLVDPKQKINMPMTYYAEHKAFVDGHVKKGHAVIGGMEEYLAFINANGEAKVEVKSETASKTEVKEDEKKPAAAEAKKTKVATKTEVKKPEIKVQATAKTDAKENSGVATDKKPEAKTKKATVKAATPPASK